MVGKRKKKTRREALLSVFMKTESERDGYMGRLGDAVDGTPVRGPDHWRATLAKKRRIIDGGQSVSPLCG